ncbi:MAG: aminoglycoside phosphotransferase family protein [Kiritimatiellae bacterium]|nr:aminoglycoside phosphotransferase family protein [Kiritimatiellia bacterium]
MSVKRQVTRGCVESVLRQYEMRSSLLDAVPYGSGHINDTLALSVDQAGSPLRYILQRINGQIFRDPPAVMENITRVTRHIAKQWEGHPDATRRTLTIVPTLEGAAFARDERGDCWRLYLFIEDARTYDIIDSPARAQAAAQAFGFFMRQLATLPAAELHETIPNFHNTPARLAALKRAIQEDRSGRAASARAEIEFLLSREEDAHRLLGLHHAGRLPLRVTHNDCKLNNVMIDDATGEGICVIDLDTVMPGLALYDFGDMVRTATSPAAEDEKELSRVQMQLPMFEALLTGFLAGAGSMLTSEEVAQLPFAGKVITMETGIRFLTDYLDGDPYFRIARPEHNLDRCRTQCRLVQSIEEQESAMHGALDRAVGKMSNMVAS